MNVANGHLPGKVELPVSPLMLGAKVPGFVFPVKHPDNHCEEHRK
jgi:hypothetical protein